MKILAFACLLAVACAYPSRLGEDKCTYGPSYWCKNYKQAIECKAIEHCRQYVWKPKGADECDLCKSAVAQLNTLVTNNSSKVLEIMNNVCAGLSSGSAECKFAVSEYGSQIISALKEVTSDSEKLCKELELCTSGGKVKYMEQLLVKQIKAHPYIVALKSVKADYCEDCKLAFGEIKDILEDQDMQKEIVTLMEDLCSEFGSVAAQCKSYVDQYLPLVLETLAGMIDPNEICNEIGLCNTTKKAQGILKALHVLRPQAKQLLIPMMPGPVIIAPPKNNEVAEDNCDECKTLLKQLNYYLNNNSTVLLKILNDLCGTLGDAAQMCLNTVKLFGGTIIQMLQKMTADSDKVCKELGMCTSADKELIIKKLLVENLKMHPKIISLKSAKDDYCNDCKLAFAELKDVLVDKAVQQEITNLLETLCTELGSLAAQCKTYVDAYLPLILTELDTLIDPTEICSELGICNTTMRGKENMKAVSLVAAQEVILVPAQKIQKSEKVEAGPECIICEFAMRELDGILGDNATKEEIEAALDKVCSLLPSTIKSECDTFIATYGPEIIDLLLKELQPDEICTELGLCSSKPIKLSFKKPSDETCDLCKMAVQYLESVLKTNATEDEIKAALEDICNLLPSSLKAECLSLVDKYTADLVWLLTEFPPYAVCKCLAIVEEYGDLIIKLILGEITPEDVCELLKLCSASKTLQLKDECALGESFWCASYMNAKKCNDLLLSGEDQASIKRNVCKLIFMFQVAAGRSKDSKTETLCQECIYAINYLGNMFPKNTTEEQIWNGLKIFCSRFPPTVMKECDQVLKDYGDFLVKLLLGEIDPSKFCKELGLCPASVEQKERFRGELYVI